MTSSADKADSSPEKKDDQMSEKQEILSLRNMWLTLEETLRKSVFSPEESYKI